MTTIRHCSINSAKLYFSSVLITSQFRVLILGKWFAINIYALFICKSQDQMILTSFSLFHSSKCQALGTSSYSLNFSHCSKHQHGTKLDSNGSSDDWCLLDGGRLTHILLDTHQKWGTLLTLLCISIYSIFGLMWFATRELRTPPFPFKQEVRTPPFPFSADTSELDSNVDQSHFTALLFLHMTTSSARSSFIIYCNCDFPLPSSCSTIVSLFIYRMQLAQFRSHDCNCAQFSTICKFWSNENIALQKLRNVIIMCWTPHVRDI